MKLTLLASVFLLTWPMIGQQLTPPATATAPELTMDEKSFQKLVKEQQLAAAATETLARLRSLQSGAAGLCSIPLINVVPPNANGTILRVPMSKDAVAPMPQIQVPAPPCPSR